MGIETAAAITAGLVLTGFAASRGAFKSPKIPDPGAPPPPPEIPAPGTPPASGDVIQSARNRRGRSSTILTTPGSLSDTGVVRPTLLGQ